MKKSVVTLLICVCCLTGCQATPEQVKENKENYNKNQQIDSVEISRCRVDELQNSVEEALKGEYENIVLPEKIDFSKVEEVNEMTFVYANDFLKNKESVGKTLGYDNLIWEEAQSAVKNERSQIAENLQEKYYIGVGDNGWTTALKGDMYVKLGEKDSTKVKAVYHIDRGEGLEEECVLNGEKTTIGNQIAYVEEWFQKEWKQWESDFEYEVGAVVNREDENGNNILMMEVDRVYGGIVLDPVGGKISYNEEYTTLESIGSCCLIGLSNKDSWDDFVNGNGLLTVKEKNAQSEIIDFVSAVRIVEKELSGFRKLDVSDVKILYTLKPVYDSTEENANYCEPGGEVYARPVYSFLIDREYEDLGLGTIDLSGMYYFVQVDMITGEVSINLSAGAYGTQK